MILTLWGDGHTCFYAAAGLHPHAGPRLPPSPLALRASNTLS